MRYLKVSKQTVFSKNHESKTPLVTLIGQGLSTKEALKRLRGGTLEEKIGGYYYDEHMFDDEDDIPDFNRMTRIDKMKLLRYKQEQIKELELNIEQKRLLTKNIHNERVQDKINQTRNDEITDQGETKI